MRELQMSEVTSGVAEVFDDVAAITLDCRFTNCTHKDEPGCAIRAAVELGSLEPARLARWQKLADEDAGNTGRSARSRSLPGETGRRR
jgi:ribosome biogenesis GTPase